MRGTITMTSKTNNTNKDPEYVFECPGWPDRPCGAI